MEINQRTIGIGIAAVVVAIMVVAMVPTVSAVPSGATTDVGVDETHTEAVSGTDNAIGGYITEVNISITQQTDKWQGYYGNVSGEIALRDAGTNVMINWTIGEVTGPLGEVYATTDTGPTWTGFTEDAVLANVSTHFGLGTAASVADGSEDTFKDVNHAAFDLSGTSVAVGTGQCAKTWGAIADQWETVILGNGEDAATDDYIFVGIIELDQSSFKSQTAADTCDFQMIVPEDPTTGSQNTYYFYVEVT